MKPPVSSVNFFHSLLSLLSTSPATSSPLRLLRHHHTVSRPFQLNRYKNQVCPSPSQKNHHSSPISAMTTSSSLLSTSAEASSSSSISSWTPDNPDHKADARSKLDVWPLDVYNAKLLNEVHPRNYVDPRDPLPIYDLVVIGAGAGGLVSSKQAARRGAKSVMISEQLAGGDCLNVGCVPSKALIRCARAVSDARRAHEFGVVWKNTNNDVEPSMKVDFAQIMQRLRKLRATIAPVDGHDATVATGAQVFQGHGQFISSDTIEVNGTKLKFKKAVIATGGRPSVPPIPGLKEAPYTTNVNLFNLNTLPPRMVILGAGPIALEMAQVFARFGSKVTVLHRSTCLFESKGGDTEAANIIQETLEEDGVTFLEGATTREVNTLRMPNDDDEQEETLPLMKVSVTTSKGTEMDIECECFLIATGRQPNVDNLGLDAAGVEYDVKAGVLIDDNARSVSNPNVYAVGDCAAGVPRLTHMSGEMAKVVVQNSLFDDDWKVSSLVVPAVMYTEPEYATVGLSGEDAAKKEGVEVDVYRAGLEHNDRAILEGDNRGFVKILTKKGTGTIVGATIVAARAGEMINEVTLAMKHGIGLDGIGRNIHAYPTTGEAVMGCGLQFINARWKRLNDN